MSLNGPSAKRSCLIIRDILDIELKNLELREKLEIGIAFRIIVLARKVRIIVREKRILHLHYSYRVL